MKIKFGSSLVEEKLRLMNDCALLDEDIESIEVKSKIEKAWKELHQPIPISPFGFLQLNPLSFSTTDLRYEGETAKFSLSLFFSPIITKSSFIVFLKLKPASSPVSTQTA